MRGDMILGGAFAEITSVQKMSLISKVIIFIDVRFSLNVKVFEISILKNISFAFTKIVSIDRFNDGDENDENDDDDNQLNP